MKDKRMPDRVIARYRIWFELLFLFVIAAILYLAMANQFGYYNDDWYSMYAARVAGPGIFHDIFASDRPGRAFLMTPLYALFGGVPLYYSLSAYLFRVLGAVGFLWLLRTVWPERRRETFLISLLFLVYPGFLSQPIAIDFQSHIVAIFLAMLSLAMTMQALRSSGPGVRLSLWAGSILTGWAYLSQMEYYIGFEVVRMLLILLIHGRGKETIREKVRLTFWTWAPYLVIPLMFLVWRFFIFQNYRPTTDLGAQLGQLADSPLYVGLWWVVYFVQDMFNILVFAWTTPVSNLALNLRLRSALVGGGITVLVLAIFFIWLRWSKDDAGNPPKQGTADFLKEGAWLGLGWVIAGLLPITMTNRHVQFFPDYSRYTLVSLGGAVIVLMVFLNCISNTKVRLSVLGLLLASASLTHYANSLSYVEQFAEIRSFWWQVSWRVPQFEQGTTLVAHYPSGGIREASFVWGPANQIYYPVRLDPAAVQTGIYAILLDHDAVVNILDRKPNQHDIYRIVATYPDFAHITAISQPSADSCVQIIDGGNPEYSHSENDSILSVGSHSEMGHILTQETFQIPPDFLFGQEPAHTWCFYYEKAAFARQRGDWQQVLNLAREAEKNGYRPDDLIEWMPFLQAYALSGDVDHLKAISRAVWSDEYVAHQACQILSHMQTLSEDVRSVVQSRYCEKP